MITTAIRPVIETEIRKTIAELIADEDLESVTIEPREDAAGEEAIFIDIRYRSSKQDHVAGGLAALLKSLSARLIAKGEIRFPYINNHYYSAQKVVR